VHTDLHKFSWNVALSANHNHVSPTKAFTFCGGVGLRVKIGLILTEDDLNTLVSAGIMRLTQPRAH